MVTIQQYGKPVRFIGISNKTLALMSDDELKLERDRVKSDRAHLQNQIACAPRGYRSDPFFVRQRRVLNSEAKRIERELTRRDFLAAAEFGRAMGSRYFGGRTEKTMAVLERNEVKQELVEV